MGPAADELTQLRHAGVTRGGLVGLAAGPGSQVGLSAAGRPLLAGADAVRLADEKLRPRWVVWSGETAATLAARGVRLATCWDIAAVHRLLFGGWRADPGWVWAHLQELAPMTTPAAGPPDLFEQGDSGDLEEPVGPDGHLRPAWMSGGWSASPGHLTRWAELAVTTAGLQQARLSRLADRPMALATACSESAAELLCAELSADGLPMDRADAQQVLAALVGPRPRTEAEAARSRAARDAAVLRHAPPGASADLRSPAQVRSLLARIGVDVPDTRAWRLRAFRDAHPLVAALLEWRKAERIATTYGYGWLDAHLGEDGRLRGTWTGSDGAAGRMTASGGLHNMPAVMRRAVVAETGTSSSGPTSARSSHGCSPRSPRTGPWPPRPQPMTCTPRSRSNSGSTGPRPRSRSWARCTGRQPGTAPRHCAGSPGPTRSP